MDPTLSARTTTKVVLKNGGERDPFPVDKSKKSLLESAHKEISPLEKNHFSPVEKGDFAMQYELTEEQVLLRDMVRKLAKEKVEPGAAARDQKAEFSWEMVELIRENGLFGVDFSEEHGGSGAGLLSLIIAVEELSKVDASVGILPVGQELGSLPILLAANPEQKKKFLPPLAAGEKLASFALTEASGGSDVASFRCKAMRKGDFYILNGSKTFITNGGVAETVSVYALTDPVKGGHKGASVFIVEKGNKGIFCW